MTLMRFAHFCGDDICTTAEEVKTVFNKEINGVNAFMISSDTESMYPYLSVLVNGRYAYLYYTPFDGSVGAGFQAYGEDDFALDLDGTTVFYVNTPTEEIEISNEYVCAREKALQVILAFMNGNAWPSRYEDLPSHVEWEEL